MFYFIERIVALARYYNVPLSIRDEKLAGTFIGNTVAGKTGKDVTSLPLNVSSSCNFRGLHSSVHHGGREIRANRYSDRKCCCSSPPLVLDHRSRIVRLVGFDSIDLYSGGDHSCDHRGRRCLSSCRIGGNRCSDQCGDHYHCCDHVSLNRKISIVDSSGQLVFFRFSPWSLPLNWRSY